jgi:hypothetical protein
MRPPEQATHDQTTAGVFSTHPFLWEDPHRANLMGESLTVKYKPEHEFSNSLDCESFSIEIQNIKVWIGTVRYRNQRLAKVLQLPPSLT